MKMNLSILIVVGMQLSISGTFAQDDKIAASTVIDTFETDSATIIDYFVYAAPEYQTFMKALNASGVNATLKNSGPFTVFAPANVAFTDLPYGNINELLAPDNKDSLQRIITYHIIPGNFDKAILARLIKERGGDYVIQTIGEAGALTFYLEGETVFVKSKTGTARSLPDPILCRDGLIYPLDTLLLP